MSTKPILFNTEMVRAILDGRKTVTRRLVKPQPEFRNGETGTPVICDDGETWTFKIDQYTVTYDYDCKAPCSKGDNLYVRETWCKGKVAYGEEPDGRNVPFISQCPGEDDIIPKEWAIREDIGIEDVVWRPSIHMPKEAARIFLRVKDVRMERLHDITEEDAKAEGIKMVTEWPDAGYFDYKGKHEDGRVWSSARECFRWGLWNSTIKPADLPAYGWDANPWVWVIEFEKISKEETTK